MRYLFLPVLTAFSAVCAFEGDRAADPLLPHAATNVNLRAKLPFDGRTVMLRHYIDACVNNMLDEQNGWSLGTMPSPRGMIPLSTFLIEQRGIREYDDYLLRCQEVEFTVADYRFTPEKDMVLSEILYASLRRIRFPGNSAKWRWCFPVQSLIPAFAQRSMDKELAAVRGGNPLWRQVETLSANICDVAAVNYYILSPVAVNNPQAFIADNRDLLRLEELEVDRMKSWQSTRLGTLLANLPGLKTLRALQLPPRGLEHLEKLVLTCATLKGRAFAPLGEARSLKTLKLTSGRVQDAEALLGTILALPALARLRLLFNGEKNYDFNSFVLRLSQIRTLEYLSLYIETVDCDSLGYVLGAGLPLRHLKFQSVRPMTADFMSRSLGLCVSLETLRLESNSLGDRDMPLLMQGIKGLAGLKILNLAYNDFGRDGIRILADHLRCFPALRKLDLEGNRLNSPGLAALSKKLPDCPGLLSLNCGNNGIGDKGGNAFAKALPFLKAIETVKLQDNQLTDTAALKIIDGLPAGIRKLDISYNRLTSACFEALSAKMGRFPDLIMLALG